MRRVVILFLVLCVFHLSWCEDSCDEPWTIILLGTKDDLHEAFEKHISKPGTSIQYQNIDGMPLLDVLKKFENAHKPLHGVEHNRNIGVVYLNVVDFYHHNYNDILKHGFHFAGNISIGNDKDVCRRLSNAEAKTQIIENVEQRAANDNTKNYCSGKLVSEVIIDNFMELYDAISNFSSMNDDSPAKFCDQSAIVQSVLAVCDIDGTENKNLKGKSIAIINPQAKFDIKIEFRCDDFDIDNTIAILAPKPFESEILYIPTIFYNHLYTVPEEETTDVFRNSIALVTAPEKLKFAFIKFIQMMKWKGRVAIISDDSAFSQEFEQGLSSLLNKEKIVHTSKSCVGVNCDFSGVFKPLRSAGAKVVIVNVGEENAQRFAKAAAGKNTQGMMWLVRAWSPKEASKAAKKLGDVYSVMLAPHFERQSNSLLEYCKRNLFCNLYEAIYTITTLSGLIRLDLLGDKLYQRNFADWLTLQLRFSELRAYVTYVAKNIELELTAEMIINVDNSVVDAKAYNIPNIRQELTDCTFKSNSFFKPCNDIEFMLIMLVISVFALTFLGIVYFFQKNEGSYSRMAC